MIPMTAPSDLRAAPRWLERSRPTRVQVWIPLFLVWLVLAPFVLLLSPLLAFGLARVRLDPFRAIGAAFRLLAALSGTRVEIETPDAFVNIRLF
jgi:hypothetical protein